MHWRNKRVPDNRIVARKDQCGQPIFIERECSSVNGRADTAAGVVRNQRLENDINRWRVAIYHLIWLKRRDYLESKTYKVKPSVPTIDVMLGWAAGVGQ